MFISNLKLKSDNCNELVSVLIPARNEEKNIANLLNDLLQQDYANIEIIVFNDLSTDRTAEIVTQIASTDSRIKLINSQGLPDGWLGKNYACHSLSQQAKGQYLLFLDADVRVNGAIILQSITLVKKYKLGLLSIFPKQIMKSFGEWLTVPNMNFILLSLLPLSLVLKSKFSSLSAANGQFMLFSNKEYMQFLPHKVFKNNKVEDIEIAHFFKQKDLGVLCMLGNNNIECRMYQGFQDAVNGFSKNVISFFGNSFSLALLFWSISTFGFLVVLFTLNTAFFAFFIAIMFIARILVSVISRQNVLKNLVLYLPQQFVMGFFIYKAFINKQTKKFEWKGREIA